MPTSHGSLLYKGLPPAPEDSIHLSRLRTAGAVIVGKTAAPEFGTIQYTKTKAWGVTRNPWNTERTPGGSSGGSAAAVSRGMVPMATASDGGGSTRIPGGVQRTRRHEADARAYPASDVRSGADRGVRRRGDERARRGTSPRHHRRSERHRSYDVATPARALRGRDRIARCLRASHRLVFRPRIRGRRSRSARSVPCRCGAHGSRRGNRAGRLRRASDGSGRDLAHHRPADTVARDRRDRALSGTAERHDPLCARHPRGLVRPSDPNAGQTVAPPAAARRGMCGYLPRCGCPADADHGCHRVRRRRTAPGDHRG